ncbi:uncharacterized protein LOC112126104 [Cimex lectularius]|uniref:Uncharacterized protein n=1 Tax=Cimex lectularius TaxID=79782 RepID=A0A8I6RPD2_CIMLE|nr:uncharacterized protein LOC112126104 [Cimex lectularius]
MDCSNCCPCLPVVEGCCFCHSLETGTKLIAIFEIVYNLALIASEGTLMAYLPTIGQASAGFDVLLDVMMVVASVLLLIALNNKMMELVNLWLVCEFIFIISGAIHCFALMVELLLGHLPKKIGSLFLLFHVLNEVLSSYFFIVVYNYYQEEFINP